MLNRESEHLKHILENTLKLELKSVVISQLWVVLTTSYMSIKSTWYKLIREYDDGTILHNEWP